MAANIQIKKFDPKKIDSNRVCVFIGKRGTGKSTLVTDVLYHHKKIPMGVIMSGTEESNEHYKKHVPDLFIYPEYDPSVIEIHKLSEREIYSSLDNGDININQMILSQFKNSLIICDEIHNVYNSIQKNNWGVAIQVVLDYFSNKHLLRVLFLSATPMTHSPSEITDLLNLLLPKNEKVTKKQFFNGDKLLPNALENIKEKIIGKISFLRDENPIYYPTRKFIGETINYISYLKSTKTK